MAVEFERPMKFRYRQRDIWVPQWLGKLLISRRKEGILHKDQNILMYIDDKPYRVGFFTLEYPTKLVEGGELEPLEIDHHIPPAAFRKEFPGVKQEEFPYEDWMPESTIDTTFIHHPKGFPVY